MDVDSDFRPTNDDFDYYSRNLIPLKTGRVRGHKP